MTGLTTRRVGRSRIYYDERLIKAPLPAQFATEYWRQEQLFSGSAGGRNLAYFIAAENGLTHEPLPLVLRHYYRGGLVARVNRDLFFGLPGQRCRSLNEFMLLQWMHEEGLPVPRPVAAHCRLSALWYSADILIEQLPCDGDLFGWLKEKPLSEAGWQAVGALVGKFHQAQVFHSDLNCHNILIADTGEARTPQLWLIDFDKCERRQDSSWKKDNLARLHRSLEKEQGLHTSFNFTPADWQSLLQGYDGETNG
ncbi:3-deoxy-D-manno-octulosonic acid kinase [Aliidiomarina sp. Khilg15.8]